MNEKEIAIDEVICCEDCDDQSVQCEDIDVDSNLLNSSSCVYPKYGYLIKVPKYLGKVSTKISLINNTSLPGGFSEIKDVKKSVVICQCKLIDKQLFIEGYILKDISYVTPTTPNSQCCEARTNSWQDITVKIPFSTAVDAKGLYYYPVYSSYKRDAYYKANTMKCNICDRGWMGESPCEKLSSEYKRLNDMPYCELKSYNITQLEISKSGCNQVGNYETLTEKIVLSLNFSIFVKKYICFNKGVLEEKTDISTTPDDNMEDTIIEE